MILNNMVDPDQKQLFRIVYSAGRVQGSITLRTNMKQLSEFKVPVIIASAWKNYSRPK